MPESQHVQDHNRVLRQPILDALSNVVTASRLMTRSGSANPTRRATLLDNQFLSWVYHDPTTSFLFTASYGGSEY
jgi:hypothetical protein